MTRYKIGNYEIKKETKSLSAHGVLVHLNRARNFQLKRLDANNTMSVSSRISLILLSSGDKRIPSVDRNN